MTNVSVPLRIINRSYPGCRRARRRGMTLLEVIISLVLIIFLISGVYGFYQSAVEVRSQGTQHSRETKLARGILAQIANEIRGATDIVPGDGRGFKGREHSITIVCTRMPERNIYDEIDFLRDKWTNAQSDLMRVDYELAWDADDQRDEEGILLCHGLVRRQQTLFDPRPQYVVQEEQGSYGSSRSGEEPSYEERRAGAGKDDVELDFDHYDSNRPQSEGGIMAPEIKYLRFRYFDGAVWRDKWQIAEEGTGLDTAQAALAGQRTYALPQAIEVTIGRQRVAPPEDMEFDPGLKDEDEDPDVYHPDWFTVVVYIPQSDRSRAGSLAYGRQANPSQEEEGGESGF